MSHTHEEHLEQIIKEKKSKSWFWNYMDKYDKKQKVFAVMMMVLVVVESVFLFLQAAKGFRTKSTEDIDLAAFILLLIINVVWFFYGWFVLRDPPVMLSGVLYTIGASLVIVTIILYGDEKSARRQLTNFKDKVGG